MEPTVSKNRMFPAVTGSKPSAFIRYGPAHNAWTAAKMPYRQKVPNEMSQ